MSQVRHDLSQFKNYKETKGRNKLLQDHHTIKVARVGEVELKLTSTKIVPKEVLHRLKIKEEYGIKLSPPQGNLDSDNRSRLIYSH